MMQPRSSANENPFEPNRDHANNGHDYNPYSDSVSTFPSFFSLYPSFSEFRSRHAARVLIFPLCFVLNRTRVVSEFILGFSRLYLSLCASASRVSPTSPNSPSPITLLVLRPPSPQSPSVHLAFCLITLPIPYPLSTYFFLLFFSSSTHSIPHFL